jgi:hypothetical protein
MGLKELRYELTRIRTGVTDRISFSGGLGNGMRLALGAFEVNDIVAVIEEYPVIELR